MSIFDDNEPPLDEDEDESPGRTVDAIPGFLNYRDRLEANDRYAKIRYMDNRISLKPYENSR